MVACLDDVLKEIVSGFKATPERWENTLMVMSTDNGGPIFAGANNYPLRYIYIHAGNPPIVSLNQVYF